MISSPFPPSCPACGREDWSIAYEGLHDRLHSIPGEFVVWRCDSCSLLQLWPVPENLASYYPQDYYSYAGAPSERRGLASALVAYVRRIQLRLAWRGHARGLKLPRFVTYHPWLRSQAFRELGEYAPPRVSSVMDIGCGGGDFLLSARALGMNVRGVEMSESAANTARRQGLRCDGTGIDGLAEMSERYDVIRLSDVLEHLADPLQALKAIAQSLSPTGVVIIRVPNVDGVLARLCGRDWFPIEAPRHLWGFGRSNLDMLLVRAGLTARSIKTTSQEYVLYCSLRNLLESQAGLELPQDPSKELLGLCARIGWIIDPAELGDHLIVVAERSPEGL
jgi:SAM-dependent methyltransferase